MKTFTNLRNLFGSETNNIDTANLTLADQWINDGHRMVLGAFPWWFMEKSSTVVTVASQQAYELPNDCLQLTSLTVTVGSQIYSPRESQSIDHWNKLNSTTAITSDTTEWYFVFGTQVSLFPKPSSSSNTVTFTYRKRIPDLSIADLTSSTVTSITNGATAMVISGGMTADMVGRWIRITQTTATLGGDGQWYEIGTYSLATSIGLKKPYQGTTIAAGTAACTIGQVPPYPEPYHTLPVHYAKARYYEQKKDYAASNKYDALFTAGITQMKKDVSGKGKSVVLDEGNYSPQSNPNLYVRL